MVKCVVSGCPNRVAHYTRGAFQPPPKRFFSFPKDPTRVQVWLAALRETHRQDTGEDLLICEDHFLPEDICRKGVTSDAIPLMPPYLDGQLGLLSAWEVDSSEEDEQWHAGGCSNDREEDECREERPTAPNPQQQDPGWDWDDNISASLQQSIKRGKPLGSLTRGFLELLLAAPGGSLDIRQVAANLQTSVQQVHAIARVLDGISLIQRESAHKIKWIGWSSISSFLWRNQQKFHREIQKLKLVEEALDGFIRSCAQQLFSLTDNVENSSLAYVTFEDISRLGVYRDQTAIIVKAPEDTKLDVPAPTEESVQLWLKAVKGPILVMTCEVGSDDAVTSDPMQRITSFLTLNESRIRTTELHERSLTDLESP
ncbi:transcription factor E2F6-like [Pundamilia nyererei]|uniref:Transcription factor E2F6-like n=1 Tax=Pundamilia nyererei TaxID=303518 RepID=A0A9Y3VJS3_9CICH|nr:PREDICTED: transcription factor E2F6-like [Pundamilia nyererei]